MKSTAPGSLLYYICLRDLFYLLLFSDLLNQKYKNTLLQFLVIYFISRSREIYLSNLLQFYLSFYPWGIDNPSLTSGCKYLFFVCRYSLRSVAWFSYWFDNLGLITEGNNYSCCAASSLPLWGNTDVVQAASVVHPRGWGFIPIAMCLIYLSRVPVRSIYPIYYNFYLSFT